MEKQFLKDFEEWVRTQITVNDLAMVETKAVLDETGSQEAAEAYIRYESKLDAYHFLLGKFANYHAGKNFHDLPDHLLGKKTY